MASVRRAAALAFSAALAVAGTVESRQDPIAAAVAALGRTDVATLQYTASGANFPLGQAPNADAPWPRFVVKRMTVLVDYASSASRLEWTRANGEDPPRGGGGTIIGEQTQALYVRGTKAWTVVEGTAVAAPAAVSERLLQIQLTPHGFLRAAKAYGVTIRDEGWHDVTMLTVTPPGQPSITATLDSRSLITRVESRIDNPVLGDMTIEAEYSDYKDFGGILFPTRIVQRQGGHPTLDVTVTSVSTGVTAAIDVPANVLNATPPPVVAQQIADGVWYLTGGTHYSVAIAFEDHLVVVEAPQSEERSLAVIAKVKELAPGKPIRYLVNTHQHFDHSGGIRTYAAEGAVIVTHALYKPYYEAVFANPRTINPDRLARSGRAAVFDTVTDKKVLSAGSRTIEIHHMKGNQHNDGLLMVYLPKEKLLVQADGFSPGPHGTPPPPTPNPFTVNLYENIERLHLDVALILALHGRVVTMEELRLAIGQSRR